MAYRGMNQEHYHKYPRCRGMPSDGSFKMLSDADSAYRVSSQTHITSMEIIRGVRADTDLMISLPMLRCYSLFAAQWLHASTPA